MPAGDCGALTTLASPSLEIASAVREDGVCHVEAVARPRPNAAIGISLWLPSARRWSGRYYQMGNGGFAGSIDRKTLAAAAARGDAAAATDTGHAGTGFDASWARGRPDLVEDYASRSIKLTADAARTLSTAYYGRAPTRRYFMGCSFGGRQALVAASRWPADWDGVIAGAPAVRWTDWLTGFAAIQHRLRVVPGGMIAPDRIGPLIAGATPTADEVRSLAVITRAGYPLVDADSGEWRRWIFNPDPDDPSQAKLATEASRYVFADAPDWSIADYRPGMSAPAAINALFKVSSLGAFLRRGGRLIAYVGTADAVLPPARIGPAIRALVPRRLAGGVRVLTVPGMYHCQGGTQPNAFGQAVVVPPLRDDARYDIRRALERWVEQGGIPTTMTVTGGGADRPQRTLRFAPG